MVRPPLLLRALFPGIIWHGDRNSRTVHLTFDDGPDPVVTPQVLDLLARYNARATFFCVGANVEAHPHLVDRILREGHALGNHTWSHRRGWGTALDDYQHDVERAAACIPSRLFRPPYGRISLGQYHRLRRQYRVVMWDVLSYDWKPERSPQQVAHTVIKALRPGSVVVFHDSPKAAPRMLPALQRLLEHLKQHGLYSIPIVP